jgi:response regulator of citrate/malate metabolism
MSSRDDREVVATCLSRGAIDYLVKPLRHNELRHIWSRVWWAQRNKVRRRIDCSSSTGQRV